LSLAAELGVADRVTLVAPQPHELLSTYYRAADVSLVPSRSESFGLVALEASACGTPVVASDVGGLSTLVDDGRTGFLVDSCDPSDFARSVRRIVEEPLLAERMSTASVLRSRDYTWRQAATRLRAIHDELISGRLVECR
jgi:D-inositol-3-phosphate glycosyltransferase